jgi:Transcriptional regulator containing PAS, AAA-type ATPase, and DNA-binding domains
MQTRLLRVLEERKLRPVGSEREVPVDVRIIAATNRKLAAEVKAGRFREDLYYRLAVVDLTLPPLRARSEDIPDLMRHFMQQLAVQLGVAPLPLSHEVVSRLAAYPWPGNVRELRNYVERSMILGCFPSAPSGTAPGASTLDEAPAAGELALSLAEVERRHIERVVDDCAGNKTEARAGWACRARRSSASSPTGLPRRRRRPRASGAGHKPHDEVHPGALPAAPAAGLRVLTSMPTSLAERLRRSVRAKLLCLVLAPLMLGFPIIMGLLGWWGESYYQRLMSSRVGSDLATAHGYLERMIEGVGSGVRGLGSSHALALAIEAQAPASATGVEPLAALLGARQVQLGLDFLNLLDVEGRVLQSSTGIATGTVRGDWPMVDRALRAGGGSAIERFAPEALEAVSPALREKARLPLVATERARPDPRSAEERAWSSMPRRRCSMRAAT